MEVISAAHTDVNGFSDEEFEKELQRRTALKDQQIASLEAEINSLRQQLARAHSDNEWLNGLIDSAGLKRPDDASQE